VMFFNLANAHAIFQHLMNNVFHEYLDDFMGLLHQWHPHFMTTPFLFMHTLLSHSCYLNKWSWLCIRCHIFLRAPKFLARPKKGLTMLKSESSWNLVPLPASNTKRGERGVLKAPGLD
jgi:hypothetical protein